MSQMTAPPTAGLSTAAAPSAASAVEVTLHPLPILSIAEHHGRTRLNRPEATTPVFGGLLGVQKGREIELVTSYELAYVRPPQADDASAMDVEGSSCAAADKALEGEVDWAFFEERTASFKQVFPTLEFIGWYTVGAGDPGERELSLHRSMLEKNDASLLLVFDPSPPDAPLSEERDLPLRIFQTAHDAGGASLGGVRLARVGGWKIESGEAERVAVSSVSQDQFGGASSAGESSLVPTLTTLRNAVQMLASRTQLILAYLRGVADGSLRRDDEVLRMIGGLMAGLPVEGGQAFRAEFETEYADVQLTSYLSTLSKSLLSLNNLTDKFTYLYAPSQNDDPLMGGGGGNGGFLTASGGGDGFGGGGGKSGGRRLGGFGSVRDRSSNWR